MTACTLQAQELGRLIAVNICGALKAEDGLKRLS